MHAQVKVPKEVKKLPVTPKHTLGLGFGLSSSLVYLPQNTIKDNSARGQNYMITYDKGNYVRFTLEYNHYRPINFDPTWFDINANVIESNVMVYARITDSHSFFYPIAGLSYNTFSGYFTGVNDYLNLRSVYTQNTYIKNNWLGLNVGIGYEYKYKNTGIYFANKWRIGKTAGNNPISIQDLCVSLGLRAYFDGPRLNRIFKGTRSRYVLSKPKPKK